MASGKPTPDAQGLSATRQMLDELDALMERMLAVPVADAEEKSVLALHPPAAPASLQSSVASLPALQSPPSPPSSPLPLTAKLTLLQVPTDDPPLDPAHPGPNPSHLPVLNVTIPLPALPETVPLPAPQPYSNRVIPLTTEPSTDSLLPDMPEPPGAWFSWFILPLVWGNRLFDRSTLLLGESGGWLRGPSGRTALGITGLALLAAASLWLMRDWLGWTW